MRAIRPDVLIVSRARDANHARHLYELGATDAVPETVEASLQLSEAALLGMGIPAGPVIASIHGKRDEIRRDCGTPPAPPGLTRFTRCGPRRRNGYGENSILTELELFENRYLLFRIML